MPTGTLTYYDPDRGFGWIGHRPNSMFVHVTELHRAGVQCPDAGMKFDFDIATAPDGRTRAVDLDWLNPDLA